MDSMKMFIPEIGTRLKLVSDWFVTSHIVDFGEPRKILLEEGLLEENRNDGLFLNYTFTIPADTTLSIKKVNLKKGGRIANHVTFYIPKSKKNPDTRFNALTFSVLLPDLLDMEFVLETCNDETKKYAIEFLEHYRNELGARNGNYKLIEKVVLNHKNLLNFSPHQNIDSFVKSVCNRLEKFEFEFKDKELFRSVTARFKAYNRKHKIDKVLA